MNINIEKISNGFLLTLGSKKVFCDVPAVVCGALAEWALAECERGSQDDVKQMPYVDLSALDLKRLLTDQQRKLAQAVGGSY